MKVELRHTDEAEHRFKIASAVNQLSDGKSDNYGEITLTANQGSTTFSDLRAGINSVILLSAKTANAAAEIGNGTVYHSASGKQTFTLTHANNAQTDRTFGYVLIG